MYKFRVAFSYKNTFDEIVRNNETLKKRVMVALGKLAENPKHSSLHSHKVNTLAYGQRWSSSATGDIRIIWDYDNENRLIILLLDIGSHSGTHKVYK
jgi:mRNA-degrading endonuclease YafQ of YafQ-DinJ toxin-antitoxin module